MRVSDLLRENDDDGISTDLRTAPCNFSVCVEYDSVCLGIAIDEPSVARKSFSAVRIVPFFFRELPTRYAANEPRIAVELIVQLFKQCSRIWNFRAPAAVKDFSVNARDHVADYVWLHDSWSICTG